MYGVRGGEERYLGVAHLLPQLLHRRLQVADLLRGLCEDRHFVLPDGHAG